MLSTFSLPRSVVAPRGRRALYTCPAATSTGAYAQCDGGFCFKSTPGQRFPGFAVPLAKEQIICSCPLTVAGPYPCQPSFFANCNNPPAGTATGDTVYVGAPTGSAELLTRLLDGGVPTLNTCVSSPAG